MVGLQLEPLGRAGLAPALSQRGVPVVHEVTPTAQGSGDVQLPPAMQVEHTPALHTWFCPQAVPLGAFEVVSTQVGPPLAEQLMFPVRHTFVGTQTAPELHTVTRVLSLRVESCWLVATTVSMPERGGAV
jgi:hypothetical protein